MSTATGNPAQFTATGGTVTSLEIPFTPTQSGTGDPSPSNVRPIVGYTEINVYRTGKNIWDSEWEQGAINQLTGQNTPDISRVRSKNYIPASPNTTYYYYCSTANMSIIYYDANKTRVGYYDFNSNHVFTTGASTQFIRFFTGSAYGGTYNNDISVNYPSTETGYNSYSGNTYTVTIPSGTGTVYGGTLDAISGVLTLTHGWTYLSSLTWIASGQTNVFRGQGLSNTPTANTYEILCSSYKVNNVGYASMSDKQISSRASFNYHEVMLKDTSYSSANDLVASFDNDDVLVYELSTPVTVNCTGVSISLLSGTNTIWTDTNGTNTVTYTEGGQTYIAKIVYKENASATPVVWMDLTQDTVTSQTLLSGYTAHKNDGSPITGSYS